MQYKCFAMSVLYVFISVVVLGRSVLSQGPSKVIYLDAGGSAEFSPESHRRGFFQNDIRIYCHRGNNKTLGRIFETIQLQLDIENDDFTEYEGATPEIVKSHYEEQKSIFSINLFSQKKTRRKLNPFAQECIGIETIQPYAVRLILIRVDFWKIIQLLLGLFVFAFAAKLSQNSIFYYVTGVLIGICLSFMLLIYLAGKLFPKRPMMYGVLIGGWAIGIYIVQRLWENLQLIVVTYQAYVFWYILITGFVSFIFCYRLGPPRNQRSKDLIKWGLQLFSLILIYFSSQFEEASSAIVIISFVLYYFPRSWLRRVRLVYLHRFPPKRRLLSNEEYYEQGVKETTKALEELRQFCSSPDCKQWRMMTRLKDPMRFASFVEGSSHIRDEEILQYESSLHDYSESEISEEEDVEMRRQPVAIPDEEISEDDIDTGYRSTTSPYNGSGGMTSNNVRFDVGHTNLQRRLTTTRTYKSSPKTTHEVSSEDEY